MLFSSLPNIFMFLVNEIALFTGFMLPRCSAQRHPYTTSKFLLEQ